MTNRVANHTYGQVAEWLKAADCKSARVARTLVRIQPCPPVSLSDLPRAGWKGKRLQPSIGSDLMHVQPIFNFLRDQTAAGVRCALITVIAVSGASTRNPGTHMAVAEDGAFVGSLSGGCIEAAVVAEALATIESGHPREVSYGAGSRFIDLRLPCGGRIDLLFTPFEGSEPIEAIMAAINDRAPFVLSLPRAGRAPIVRRQMPTARLSLSAEQAIVGHFPDLRLIIMGHGASVTALAALARAMSVDTLVVSPDTLNLAQAQQLGVMTCALKTMSDETPEPDAWTAVAFLFHEHDWEAALLARALATPAFYVGAMGSYKTHDARTAALAAGGVAAADRARIIAPIGLIPSSRDPETLALSTLTQVVAAYHQLFVHL